MESEDEHMDYGYSSHPYLRLYEEQENERRIHNAVHKSEFSDSSWLSDPQVYVPLRFFKTIQGFHKVRLHTCYT
jgi:hypothetical protein